MIKLANHIKRIEISSLWSGHKHIVWDLRPDVNVLSGHNGAGKSTILNRLIQHLRSVPTTGDIQGNTRFGVKMEFDPERCHRHSLRRHTQFRPQNALVRAYWCT